MRPPIKFISNTRGVERELTEEELEKVYELALLHTTDKHIANSLDFNLQNWVHYKSKHPEVQELIDKAQAAGAGELRRAQWKAALSGNVNMQIWLGRCILGQNKDTGAVSVSAPQLSDISPESRENLIELRNAIYGEHEKQANVIELTPVNEVESPAQVGSGVSDAEAAN